MCLRIILLENQRYRNSSSKYKKGKLKPDEEFKGERLSAETFMRHTQIGKIN